LMNVLANRIRHKGSAQRVSGTVLLDGKKLEGAELRKRIAYVMQTDLLFATQTPRESLLFSAMLRLPSAVPMAEKKQLVETMLADLGLLDCADTFCGDEMIRGLSGGEKKRTAIGIELVMKPELIFLDEPTSGLDSFAAQSVCRKLVELGSTRGCNILCTIHQPASEVFHTFNKVMTLYKGQCLYYGPIKGLSAGLTANGASCPAEYNLADHVISVIQTSEIEALDKLRDALIAGKFSEASKKGSDVEPVPSAPKSEEVMVPALDATDHLKVGHSAGFFLQLWVLTKREAQYVWRNKPGLIASIIVPLILNAVFACIFEGVGDMGRSDYSTQGHFGAVAQVLIGGMFGAAQPLLLRFPLDRGIFLREYATSTYGAAPYFLSKTMVELPQGFMNACLVWLAFYWVAGLQGSWILHVLIFWMAGITAGSTALLVGCLAANPEVAQQSAPPVFVLQLLFAGVFLPVSKIPSALRWIQWIASLKYAINLNILVEFGETTREKNNWTDANTAMAIDLIERNDVDPERWWFSVVMLVVLFLSFRFVSILALAHRAASFF